MNIKNWILHPILFSIYPVLFYYSLNIGQVHPESVFKPLTFTVLLAIGGWCFLRLMLKDWFRSGEIVSLLIILIFSYGHTRTNIDFQGAAYFLPAIWISALVVVAFAIIRSGDNFINGTKILNVISAVLCILVAANIVSTQVKMVKEVPQQPYFNGIPQGLIDKDKKQLHPDIYFIILDAYARQDVLKDVYDFDNSKFLDGLESKGFYIADKAISNYGQTGLSVGSSLNLNYLGEWAKKIGENNINRAPLHHIINQNQAQIFLKKQGYKIIAFASTRPEMQMKSADVIISSGTTVNEFHEGLKNATPLPDMGSSDNGGDTHARYRMHTMFTLNKLGKVALEHQGPKFIFAHIGQPHPPFIFGPDGEPVRLESRFNDHDGNMLIRPGRLTAEQYRKHYRDQLILGHD